MYSINGNINKIDRMVRKGQIWYADLGIAIGSIQGGIRPVYVQSNDRCNLHSPVITVVPITSAYNNKSNLPTHVSLSRVDGVSHNSIALAEQVRPLNKKDLGELVSQKCLIETMCKLDRAYNIQGGTDEKSESIDINKLIDLSEKINDEIDYLRYKRFDNRIYHECSMLVAELKEYCFKSNINFEIKYKGLINRFRNLKTEERIACEIAQ